MARQALSSGRSVTSLVVESGLLAASEVNEVLQPDRLAKPLSEPDP
nr:hypothetical protein [Hoyosella subflava]